MNAALLLLLAGLSAMAYATESQPANQHHRGFLSDIWNTAKGTAEKVKDKVEDVVGGAWNSIKNVFGKGDKKPENANSGDATIPIRK